MRPQWTEKIALDAILRFNLPKTFPVGEQASFEDIARASGVDVNHVRRLLRLGMTEHLFCEPRTGFVAHTALTQHLATNESLHNYISTSLAEFRPAGAKVKRQNTPATVMPRLTPICRQSMRLPNGLALENLTRR